MAHCVRSLTTRIGRFRFSVADTGHSGEDVLGSTRRVGSLCVGTKRFTSSMGSIPTGRNDSDPTAHGAVRNALSQAFELVDAMLRSDYADPESRSSDAIS